MDEDELGLPGAAPVNEPLADLSPERSDFDSDHEFGVDEPPRPHFVSSRPQGEPEHGSEIMTSTIAQRLLSNRRRTERSVAVSPDAYRQPIIYTSESSEEEDPDYIVVSNQSRNRNTEIIPVISLDDPEDR